MRKILVVETDPWWQDALHIIFKNDDFVFADNSQKAVDFIFNNYIDLIVLNESILQKDSFSCIRKIREIYKKEIFFILLNKDKNHLIDYDLGDIFFIDKFSLVKKLS